MGNVFDCGTGQEVPQAGTQVVDPYVMPSNDPFVLEGATRLQDSLLWKMQAAFYAQHNIKAWSDKIVPNFVTTNSFVGRAYANFIMGVLRDLFESDAGRRGDAREPVYIVEVGAGHGKLGYLILQALVSMKASFPKHQREFPFVYVLTDFTAANVEFWLQHPQLAEFYRMGILDVAQFDAETDTSLVLQNSGVTLSAASPPANPIIALCNYVFDTLRADAFRIVNSELQQGYITLMSSKETDKDDNTNPDIITRASISWNYKPVPVDMDVFDDDDFNFIVRSYQERMDQGAFLVPVGGLRLVRGLASIANNQLVMLVGDKGYLTESEMTQTWDPHVALHGSFSLMVNFHALRLYFLRRGGFSVYSPHLDGFKVAAFVLGGEESQFKMTKWAFREHLAEFGPDSFAALQRGVKDECREPSRKLVLSLLRLAEHDADIFWKFKQRLFDLVSKMDVATAASTGQLDLERDLIAIVEANYTLVPDRDVCFEVGRLMLNMGRYEQAAILFNRSIQFCGEHHVTWYNLGVCHHKLQQLPEALRCLRESLRIAPDYHLAVQLHNEITGAMTRGGAEEASDTE